MTKRIWKWPLKVTDEQVLDIPDYDDEHNGRILCVKMQGETPCLWAMIDPEKPTEKRTIRIIGTGHPIEDFDEGKMFLGYIGSFKMLDDSLIFHVFEKELLTEL